MDLSSWPGRLGWRVAAAASRMIGRARTPSVEQRRLRTRRLAKPTNGVVYLLCLATGRSVRAVTPGKSAAVLGPKTQVRLHGRVNCALIQRLTILVSKRKEVGFQIKNLVVDLVAAIVHQANIATLKRAAISRQDWEVVIRTVPDVRRMPLLGEGRVTLRTITVFPHRATIDVSVFHRHIIAHAALSTALRVPAHLHGGSGRASGSR